MNREVLIRQAAKELGMPIRVVREVYNAYWLEIKRILDAGPKSQVAMSKEAFKAKAYSIRFTGLGFLYFDYSRYLARRHNEAKRKAKGTKKENS